MTTIIITDTDCMFAEYYYVLEQREVFKLKKVSVFLIAR